jgi:mono/diheme cytochrome c family protein
MRIPFLLAALALLPAAPAAADGKESYRTRCALCHGGDGAGTDRAASILPVLHASGPDRLARIVTEGVPARGMPRFEVPTAELADLVAHLKALAAAAAPAARDPLAPRRCKVQVDGMRVFALFASGREDGVTRHRQYMNLGMRKP